MYINVIGSVSILLITCLTGLIAYAVYYKCDILSAKIITKGEQVYIYSFKKLTYNVFIVIFNFKCLF